MLFAMKLVQNYINDAETLAMPTSFETFEPDLLMASLQGIFVKN